MSKLLNVFYLMPAEQFKNATMVWRFRIVQVQGFLANRLKTLHFVFAACVRKGKQAVNQCITHLFGGHYLKTE